MLFVSDAAVLWLAFAAAYWMRTVLLEGFFWRKLQPFGFYVLPGAVVIALALAAIALTRMYEDRRYLSRLEVYAGLVKGISYGILVAIALTFFVQAYDYSRIVLLFFWMAASVLLVLERSLWHQFFKALRRRGRDIMKMALVGEGSGMARAAAILRRFPELGYRVTVRIAVGRGNVRSHLAKLEELVSRGAVSGVLIGVPASGYHRAVPYLAWCEENYVPHHRISGVFDMFHGGGSDLASLPAVDDRPLYSFVKRIVDEFAALVLLVLTAPVLLAIAAAVRLDSPGPVLFAQDRVGRNGRIFRVLKFRTMYAHAPRYAVTVRRPRDPRVTPVGRFLRRMSLDELPQLLNILKGEMSFVGPRPEMPFMMRKNSLLYQRRLMVLPGLTGLWQAVARDEPLENSLRYDVYYIRHRSFIFDLVILARTVLSVVSGRGAY